MELTAEQRELIERHLDAVIEMNKKINLTRVVDRDSGLVLHIEDSLSGVPEFLECPEGAYADLGSGGGFPASRFRWRWAVRCFWWTRWARRCARLIP